MEQADNSLLAGHLNVIRGLLSCEGVRSLNKIVKRFQRSTFVHFLKNRSVAKKLEKC